jgi:hypothetical protein
VGAGRLPLGTVASIEDVRQLIPLDHGLASLAVTRPDGSVQITVVNAGVITHPVTGTEVAAFIAHGAARKVDYLRQWPQATLLWRAGWAWVAVEGLAEIYDPSDSSGTGRRSLFHMIAEASGNVPADWDEFDRVTVAEGRTAVLVTPKRIYRNP